MSNLSTLYAGIGFATLGVVLSFNYLRRQHFARLWTKQLKTLDPKIPNDTDLIVKHVIGYDYPFEMFVGLHLGFYRTSCSPTIAGVYHNTGVLENTTDKRVCDTALLIYIWMDYGLDSELGKTSFDHVGKIHGLHASKTRNADFIFVLCCLVVDGIQFSDDYGWKKMEPKEKEAFWEFFRRVGECMELKEIPNSLEECHAFVDKYVEDDRSARVSKAGLALTKVITDLVCEWYYLAPPFLCRLTVNVLLYQMGPTFHAKLGLKKPAAISFGLINSALWARKQLLRFVPPRTYPFKLSEEILSTKYGCPVSKQIIAEVGPVDMLAKINAQ